MNAHIAINARLTSFAGLTALVGTRIYPDISPSPGVWPCVVWFQVHGDKEVSATTDTALSYALIQVSSFDKTRLGAETVAAQVKLALNRWRQTTIAGVTVDDCIFMSDMDLFEPVSKVYQMSADYRFHFRE